MAYDKHAFAQVFTDAFNEVASEIAADTVFEVTGGDDVQLISFVLRHLHEAGSLLGYRNNLVYDVRGYTHEEFTCLHTGMQKVAARIEIVVQGYHPYQRAFAVRVGPPLYALDPAHSDIYRGVATRELPQELVVAEELELVEAA